MRSRASYHFLQPLKANRQETTIKKRNVGVYIGGEQVSVAKRVYIIIVACTQLRYKLHDESQRSTVRLIGNGYALSLYSCVLRHSLALDARTYIYIYYMRSRIACPASRKSRERERERRCVVFRTIFQSVCITM